jgi:hypothetical protein
MADWTQRELCPDGACIGLIGAGGVCNVCGRAGTKRPAAAKPDEAEPTSAAADDGDDEDEDDEDYDESADHEEDGDDDDDDDDDDEDDEDDEDDDDGDDDDDDDGDDDESDDDDDDDDEGEAEADEDGAVTTLATSDEPGAKGGEWKARKLCPDGSCIGVIGSDDKCKVCGKSPA